MARTRSRHNKVSRARRVVPVREENRRAGSPFRSRLEPFAARDLYLGTHLRTLSDDIMGSNLVPSSGVEVLPEVQTGCLAARLDVHQPICMGLQPSRTDFDVLTLAEFEAAQTLESTDIDAANLQTVIPHEFGNQSLEGIPASPFLSYGSRASPLSCGAGNPASEALNAAPIAADYSLPRSLFQGPELISSLPEIVPLTKAEESHMLAQLFLPEQDQSLQNTSSVSPQQQLYQPDHLVGPMQTVNYDPPSHSPTGQSLPPNAMTHHSAGHSQSLPFGQWHQQSPQEPLTDSLDRGMQQLVRGAANHSSRSSERCAVEYPPGYPTSPNSDVIEAIVSNIVEAAPTVNITPFKALAEPPDNIALPTSAHVPNGSANSASANSASANETTLAARIVTGRRGRGTRNRLPQRRQATARRLRQIRPAPATE